MKIKFKALDYTADDLFIPAEYEFDGDKKSGWEITRNGRDTFPSERVRAAQDALCGVCSTDLSRSFCRFPAPSDRSRSRSRKSRRAGSSSSKSMIPQPQGRQKTLPLLESRPSDSRTQTVWSLESTGCRRFWALHPRAAECCYPVSKHLRQSAVLIEPFAAALQA